VSFVRKTKPPGMRKAAVITFIVLRNVGDAPDKLLRKILRKRQEKQGKKG
jgi:hypothetical protein